MKIDEILKLVNAGYSKDEITALDTSTEQKTEQKQEQKQEAWKQEPEQEQPAQAHLLAGMHPRQRQ